MRENLTKNQEEIETKLGERSEVTDPYGDEAREAINEFVSELPEQAQVTLQVYGHEGSGSEEDKEMSCDSVETLYSFDKYEEGEFQDALNKFEPAGWTPLAKAIEDVTEEFDGEDSTNVIYVVSDGEETCGGDPVESVEKLADSNIEPVINLIGYQATDKGIDELKEMAEAADGNFINATDQEQLNEEFEQMKDMSTYGPIGTEKRRVK